MRKILILGAGKIGSFITSLLHQSNDYQVCLADIGFHHDSERLLKHCPDILSETIDVGQTHELKNLQERFQADAIISSLPFYLNKSVAQFCHDAGIHYFDLTEDNAITDYVKSLASTAKSAFIPQCGIAPGFVGLAAHSLMQSFDRIESASLRVGALPQSSNNGLFYALTWSTEGLINEYLKPCHAIEQGRHITLPAMDNYEKLNLQGEPYEAFNTSGGLGSLAKRYQGKVQTMNYKTLRYPGHHEKMRFLLEDLKLNVQHDLLKAVLENAIPRTYQDVVIIYLAVSGHKDGGFIEDTYFKKVYPQVIGGLSWSAIQITTGSALCAVVDLFFENPPRDAGFIHQEDFSLDAFLENRFGKVFA